MHDYLNDHEPPIDYTRRRRLDYSTLLTETQWQKVCATAGISTCAVHIDSARLYLYERISGMTAITAGQPWPAIHNGDLFRRMSRQLTPELAASLDDCAGDFLASQHVTGEPIAWAPGAAVIVDLAPPGAVVLDVDIAALHTLIREEHLSVAAAAKRLGRPIDHVRDLLMTSPAPASKSYDPAYGPKVHEILTRDELYRRYEIERQSMRAIGDDLGYSKRTIWKALQIYGIRVHDKHGQ